MSPHLPPPLPVSCCKPQFFAVLLRHKLKQIFPLLYLPPAKYAPAPISDCFFPSFRSPTGDGLIPSLSNHSHNWPVDFLFSHFPRKASAEHIPPSGSCSISKPLYLFLPFSLSALRKDGRRKRLRPDGHVEGTALTPFFCASAG